MVAKTLALIDGWFNQPSLTADHTNLLSKLAALELCGWIEEEFDRLALLVEQGRLNDPAFVKKELIKKTYGFKYEGHLRRMLVGIVGEVFVRRIEAVMEQSHPGDLDVLKAKLEALWKIRCDFAHADVVANANTQSTFHAPSWVVGEHREIQKLIGRYEGAIAAALAPI